MTFVLNWIVGHFKTVLYALGVAAVAAAYFLIRQSGADAEKAKQAARDLKAARTIAAEKTEAREMTDEDLDREVDRWSRKG